MSADFDDRLHQSRAHARKRGIDAGMDRTIVAFATFVQIVELAEKSLTEYAADSIIVPTLRNDFSHLCTQAENEPSR
jgi:hypothetical protein